MFVGFCNDRNMEEYKYCAIRHPIGKIVLYSNHSPLLVLIKYIYLHIFPRRWVERMSIEWR
jgi:hypothetical protein